MCQRAACGDVYSVDPLRAAGRRAKRQIAQWEASWPIRASQLYVCSFYFWSAIAKARMSGTTWIGGGERLQHLLLNRSTRYGFEDGIVEGGSQLAFEAAHNAVLCEMLGIATYFFEFGFPLILLVRGLHLRLAFFAGVTLFHIANFILINVQFVLLPIVFLLFFDVSMLAKRWRWMALYVPMRRQTQITSPNQS